MKYWWYGVNNKLKRDEKSKPHVIYPEIEPLLRDGVTFDWPYGGTPKSLYNQMSSGDKVILWMGDGNYQASWGILAIAEIIQINDDKKNKSYTLAARYVLDTPLQPYPSKKPKKTVITENLKNIFGIDFKSLQKVYRNVGYIDKLNSVATTIAEISEKEYNSIIHLLNIPQQHILQFDRKNDVFISPEEIQNTEKYFEGATSKITVNIYERNTVARQKCIEYYGINCYVCGFNFEEKYSYLGKGFIHVHYLKPLSEIGEEYELNAVQDLRPVCPNCHVMLHKRKPPFSIEELKQIINS